MPVPPVNGNVPIVGQSVTLFRGAVQAVFRCNCDPKNQPSLIIGTEVVETCLCCGNAYGIVRVSFDRAKGEVTPTVTIGCFGKRSLAPNP